MDAAALPETLDAAEDGGAREAPLPQRLHDSLVQGLVAATAVFAYVHGQEFRFPSIFMASFP